MPVLVHVSQATYGRADAGRVNRNRMSGTRVQSVILGGFCMGYVRSGSGVQNWVE